MGFKDMSKSILSLKEQAMNQIAKYNKRVTEDPFRLDYHLMPPVGLLNDPNGFVYFKGQYHIFYQWNPFATDHTAKFWGHYISADLVHWTFEPIALAPDSWFDKNGCYSGSAIVIDDKLYLFYTGNVKDEAGNREAYQCMAISEDGIHFEKKGPVVYRPEGYTGHFRDPKVFKANDHWYMVIGAQTLEENGEVVIFSSKDLENWTFQGPLAGNDMNGLDDFGYMWECPDLFKLNEKDILIISPQGLEAEGYKYNNIFQSGYFSGTASLKTMTFEHGDFNELDRGFDFYAPQTMLDEKGRQLLFAWMGNADEAGTEHPTERYHWIHSLTLPRQLEWKNDRLYQTPVKELEKLRKDGQFYQDVIIYNQEVELENINGNVLELFIKINESNIQDFSIRIGNQTYIIFNQSNNIFTFQRKSLTHSQLESRHCHLDDLRNIHIFKDTSSIEIFINNGEEVFSSRLFDQSSDRSITFSSKNKISIDINKWNLNKVLS